MFLKDLLKDCKKIVTIGAQHSQDDDYESFSTVLKRANRHANNVIAYAMEEDNADSIDAVIINGSRPHSDAMVCLEAIKLALKNECKIVLVGTLPQEERNTVPGEDYVGELYKTALNFAECGCDLETYNEQKGITVVTYKGEPVPENAPSDYVTFRSAQNTLKSKLNIVKPKVKEFASEPTVEPSDSEDKPVVTTKSVKRKKRKK